MIEGLLRHRADTEIESDYVDTHGASVVGFASTELPNFRLLPRPKNIGSIRLYRPDDTPPGRPALGSVKRFMPVFPSGCARSGH
ncbi:Tn3 family transposase [Streptomyces sp. NPDC058664]|uniref:Tn3 family transposase n=1 Tax=unclassified Streptomyces TaxID=2593676 RepID=UPI003659A71B